MLDYHIHLERGAYSKQWLSKFLDVGKKSGIREFGFVEHLYIFQEAKDLLIQNEHVKAKQVRKIDEYFAFINNLKEAGLPVRLGLEVDYLPEKEKQIKDYVKNLPVDFLIGSVHYLDEWGFDLDSDWQSRNIETVYRHYFSVLLKAAESGIFDILGHCGNIAYYGHRLDSQLEQELFRKFFQDIARTNIVLEINTGGLYRPAGIVFPQLEYLPILNDLGIELTTSSDAHDPCYTGWEINKLVIPALKKAKYQYLQSFKNRKRVRNCLFDNNLKV